MFPTATKKNDKKHQGSSDASESKEDEVLDYSPKKQLGKKEKSKRTNLACKYLQLIFIFCFSIILFSIVDNALITLISFSCFMFLKHTATKKKNK
jgi:hypothetical protein